MLYGSFLLLKPANLDELAGGTVIVNGQPVRLPVEPVIRVAAIAISAVIAAGTGLGMSADWTTFALYWNGALSSLATAQQAASQTDPIFGRPTGFLFLHAAGLAPPRRLADDDVDHRRC